MSDEIVKAAIDGAVDALVADKNTTVGCSTMARDRTATSDLLVDSARQGKLEYGDFMPTGIFVRAKLDGKWDAYDIVALDSNSLLTWLRSRGGHNPWAENCVLILLGHDPIA